MLKRLVIGSVLLALCGLASVRQAKADDIDTFTFTTTSGVYSWQILPSPTAVAVDPNGTFFQVNGVPYTLNGVAPTGTFASPTDIQFFLGGTDGGGFELSAGVLPTILLNTEGAQLFTTPSNEDPLATPTFTLIPVDAPVTLDDFTTGLPAGTLSIVSTPIPVVGTPEPSSLLLTGLGLIGLLGLAWKKQIVMPFRCQAGSEA